MKYTAVVKCTVWATAVVKWACGAKAVVKYTAVVKCAFWATAVVN